MRERYTGPLEPGMILTAPDNDGVLGFRRDKLLARHPDKSDMWIFEALPCRMRLRGHHYEGAGSIGLCPEMNIRIIMRPEEESA